MEPEILRINPARFVPLASAFRAKTGNRANPELVRQTVLALCDGRYLGLRVLADLLKRRDRDGKDLRTRILNPLVDEGVLLRAFPKTNDPRQAYISSPVKEKDLQA